MAEVFSETGLGRRRKFAALYSLFAIDELTRLMVNIKRK